MRRLLTSLALATPLFFLAGSAWADKVAVLPFSSPKNLPRPELDEARRWTREAVTQRGHTYATDHEMVSAEAAVRDGVADTRQEYLAAGKAVSAEWSLSGRVERNDYPPARLPDGREEDGYTTYRIELEACQISSGRVESLSREVVADDAPNGIAEMLALLLRPEGIANADIPWERTGVPRPKPRPKPVVAKPAPEPAAPPPPETPPPPRIAYGEGHPAALGVSIGFTSALVRPDEARGPSAAMPIGGVLAYAFAQVPGLEFRAQLTSQVIGPKALEIAAGARYALAPFGGVRFYLGPELLLGLHAALGGNETARFLTHPALFLAYGITERVQAELAGDLVAAFGGGGALVLGGGTARVLVRF